VDALGGNRRGETRWRREKQEAMWRGQAGADRPPRNAGEVAVEPASDDEFFHCATEPVAFVTVAETLFEEAFQHRWSAVRVVPDEVLGVKPGPILFEDAIVRFELLPHFGLRVRAARVRRSSAMDSGVSEGRPMM
jgi:hypothetical protein